MSLFDAPRLVGAGFAILLILPLGTCTSSQLGPRKPLDAPGGALLTVVNHHVHDMRVYLIRGSTPVPLGSVSTLERRTFALPTSMIGHSGTVRLMADPLGSRNTFTSDFLPATPGDHLQWELAPSLPLSRFSVRRVGPGFLPQ